MKNALGYILGGLLVVIVLLSTTLFTVDEREKAIVLQLGEIRNFVA